MINRCIISKIRDTVVSSCIFLCMSPISKNILLCAFDLTSSVCLMVSSSQASRCIKSDKVDGICFYCFPWAGFVLCIVFVWVWFFACILSFPFFLSVSEKGFSIMLCS